MGEGAIGPPPILEIFGTPLPACFDLARPLYLAFLATHPSGALPIPPRRSLPVIRFSALLFVFRSSVQRRWDQSVVVDHGNFEPSE